MPCVTKDEKEKKTKRKSTENVDIKEAETSKIDTSIIIIN